MKAFIGGAAIIIALATVTSAEAKGCLKGAVLVELQGIIRGTTGYWERGLAALSDATKQTSTNRMEKNQIDKPNRELRNGEERL